MDWELWASQECWNTCFEQNRILTISEIRSLKELEQEMAVRMAVALADAAAFGSCPWTGGIQRELDQKDVEHGGSAV